jgi:hypothetical protein
VFAYRPTTKAFNLKLSFAKSRASRDDIIDALEAIIRISARTSKRNSRIGVGELANEQFAAR